MKIKTSHSSGAGVLCAVFPAAGLSSAQVQNVGIGTTTPASKLTVNGNAAIGTAPYKQKFPCLKRRMRNSPRWPGAWSSLKDW